MKSILSIQSHVAYGYVGNRASVFPLQRLGFDVTAINTVEFSNHTGYGTWKGEVFTPNLIHSLIEGVRERGIFPNLSALLTGYMGNPALGQLIEALVHELKSSNPNCLYCCDPVMGDTEGGCYVHPEVGNIFKKRLASIADILTPNPFELQFLTDMPVMRLEQVQEACDQLIKRGPRMILVTSVLCEETPDNSIQMLLHQTNGSWIVTMPKLNPKPAPNGAGDVTAALFLAHTLNGLRPEEVLAKTAASVYGIYEATTKAGTRELQLISAQDELVTPHHHFEVRKI